MLGIVAGWRAQRPDLAEGLKDAQRGHTAGRSMAFLRRGLVIAQLAVSVVLVIGAGLLGRSLASLLSQDLGFRRDRLLTIDLSSPAPKVRPTGQRLEIDDPPSLLRQAQLNQRLIERLGALPGVNAGGGVNRFPMSGGGSAGTFIIARATDQASRRLTFLLTMSFAVAAVLVAVLGIYGVLSYLVAQRSQEFGIRIALGAQWSDVQRLVLGEAVRLVLVGLALGVGIALAMSRGLNGMLFGIKPTDPTTYVAMTFLLAIAALAACEMPAIRATRVDPAKALRTD